MKPEEAIETIKVAIAEVEWNYPMDYTVAFETAIEALEKADKYRWHDLRKKPDDLPEADGNDESDYVLVMIGTPEWYNCEWAYYNHDKKVWSTHEQQDGFAWRYIEPFKEEE